MKTAVSIPDDLYNEVEKLAKGLRLSRSALYARALARFVHDADARQITAALNEVYRTPQRGEELIDRAAANVLEDEGW